MSFWKRRAKEEGIAAAVRVAPGFLMGIFNILRSLFRRESPKEAAIELVEDLAEEIVNTGQIIVEDGVQHELDKLDRDD